MDLVTNVVSGTNAERLLLLLHGYGADERDLGGLLGYLDPEGHFAAVMPRGPVAAPPGFSWFDITSQEPDASPRPSRRRSRRSTTSSTPPATSTASTAPRPSSAASPRAAGWHSRSASGPVDRARPAGVLA